MFQASRIVRMPRGGYSQRSESSEPQGGQNTTTELSLRYFELKCKYSSQYFFLIETFRSSHTFPYILKLQTVPWLVGGGGYSLRIWVGAGAAHFLKPT